MADGSFTFLTAIEPQEDEWGSSKPSHKQVCLWIFVRFTLTLPLPLTLTLKLIYSHSHSHSHSPS